MKYKNDGYGTDGEWVGAALKMYDLHDRIIRFGEREEDALDYMPFVTLEDLETLPIFEETMRDMGYIA